MTSGSSSITSLPTTSKRVVGQGYDPVEWVRKVVLPRIERSPENGRYLFPDPLVDLQTFSQMHSWYKHYSNEPGRFYPILRIGPEKRGLIDLTKQRAPAEASVPLHWAFLQESTIMSEDRDFCVGFELEYVPWQIMRDCYFFVSWEYSSFSLDRGTTEEHPPFYDFSVFTARCALDACCRIRERIVRLLLAIDDNPPTAMTLTVDRDYDGRKNSSDEAAALSPLSDEKESLIINGRAYAVEYDGEPIKWRETNNRGGIRFETVSDWYQTTVKRDESDESRLIDD